MIEIVNYLYLLLSSLPIALTLDFFLTQVFHFHMFKGYTPEDARDRKILLGYGMYLGMLVGCWLILVGHLLLKGLHNVGAWIHVSM